MIYNASEKDMPDVDGTIPPVKASSVCNSLHFSPVEVKYGIKTDVRSITSDPKNKNWIQGAPAVYLNNEAPLHSRVLDALSCAIRSCCDQANSRFAAIAKENSPTPSDETAFNPDAVFSPTATAVLAHENELCSRNVVLSAYALLQQDEANKSGQGKSEGLHLVMSAMDAFIDSGDADQDGYFTDRQIQSLLSVCNSAVENPLVLHHAGPTYHMVSNAAILLCHLLNGMQAMKGNNQFGPMEATMFEEVLDTFVAVRKLLTIHRRKLPVRLRCHGIPRPQLRRRREGGGGGGGDDGDDGGGSPSIVDLGETLLCPCRGCQGFVLMACSPCVAAERARSAASRLDVAVAQEAEAVELGEIGNHHHNGHGGGTTAASAAAGDHMAGGGSEFDLDDDALLSLISTLIGS